MRRKGFTLIELLIVVAIIGIVAAIAIPNLLTAVQKSKQKATMGDMKAIGTAVESYVTDNYLAPTDLTAAGFGGAGIRSFHMKKFPDEDAWGNTWTYIRNTSIRDVYSIGAPCRDGAFDGFDQEGSYITNSLEDFGNDIIFSVGVFVYGPKVK